MRMEASACQPGSAVPPAPLAVDVAVLAELVEPAPAPLVLPDEPSRVPESPQASAARQATSMVARKNMLLLYHHDETMTPRPQP
jgi:hypothetical protein